MKKIMYSDLPLESGKIRLASAVESVKEGIYGCLLETEEEQDCTCYFGTGDVICSTCNPATCNYFVEWENGEIVKAY